MAANASEMVLKSPLPSFATVTFGVGLTRSAPLKIRRSSWLTQVGTPSESNDGEPPLFSAIRRRLNPGTWNAERKEVTSDIMARELLVNCFPATRAFSILSFVLPSGNPSMQLFTVFERCFLFWIGEFEAFCLIQGLLDFSSRGGDSCFEKIRWLGQARRTLTTLSTCETCFVDGVSGDDLVSPLLWCETKEITAATTKTRSKPLETAPT